MPLRLYPHLNPSGARQEARTEFRRVLDPARLSEHHAEWHGGGYRDCDDQNQSFHPEHNRACSVSALLWSLVLGQTHGDGENRMLKWLGLGLLLGTGFGSVAWSQGSAKFDGQYMGELTLTKEISGDCTQPPPGALYPLTVSRGEVRFAYVPRFDTTLSGKVDENGIFKAYARLRKGFLQMTGRIQGSNLTAHIVSPSCNYTFQTKK
jgi:hypothetical protein